MVNARVEPPRRLMRKPTAMMIAPKARGSSAQGPSTATRYRDLEDGLRELTGRLSSRVSRHPILRQSEIVRPRTKYGWASAAAVLVSAVVLAACASAALLRSAVLVDQVPGADAGLATSAALEAARAQASLFAVVLLALGIATAVVLTVRARRPRSTG